MTDPNGNTVVIITALAMEMVPIAKQLRLKRTGRHFTGKVDDLNVVGAISGMGAERAVKAFNELAEAHQPALVLLAGFAGALDPFYQPGYVLSAATVCDEQGSAIEIDEVGVTVVSVAKPVTTAQAKRALHEQHNAAAVDMESFAIAQAAKERNLDLRIVRTISDAADQLLPEWSANLVCNDGSADIAAAIGMLLLHPTRLGPMLAMRRGAKAAAEALGTAAAGKIATWFATMMQDDNQ